MREVRSIKARELRVENTEDGKRYLSGYAATFNTLSNDMGGWRERIRPGAFARAIAEKQDVRHTVNHAINNALVLGRTAAGTTELHEDATGLAFRTLINEEDPEATAFASRVKRGDINENSFAFYVHGKDGQAWEGDVRELRDLDIDDISTVIYAAYPGTSAAVAMRSMFPEGVPPEIRSRIARPAVDADRVRLEGISVLRSMRAVTPRAIERRAAVQPDGTLEILIYEDIGVDCWTGGGVTAKGIKQQIDEAGPYSKIQARINSFGGDGFEGLAIYNLLRAQGKPIECCIDGIAASAASVIAMCGDSITMGVGAMMMVHNASGGCYGYALDMRQTADMLDKVSSSIAQTYVARTGKPMEDLQTLMDAESWLTAPECLAAGLCTAVAPGEDPDKEQEAEEEMAAAARSSRALRSFRNAPDRFKNPRNPRQVEQRDRARLARVALALAEL